MSSVRSIYRLADRQPDYDYRALTESGDSDGDGHVDTAFGEWRAVAGNLTSDGLDDYVRDDLGNRDAVDYLFTVPDEQGVEPGGQLRVGGTAYRLAVAERFSRSPVTRYLLVEDDRRTGETPDDPTGSDDSEDDDFRVIE